MESQAGQPSDVRECRICREEVSPTYEDQSYVNQVRGKQPKKIYFTEGSGYLISPCKCKGSVKYVHEDCLQTWRYQHPGSEHQWRCPQCGYTYRLQRMTWARRVRSPLLAFFLAVSIFAFCIFLLGFVADPILDLWLDPVGTITSSVGLTESDLPVEPETDIDVGAWTEHWLKGLFSLGLLGFVKAFLVMSPWQWWNLRTSGLIGTGRRAGTGRERVENISLALVFIGAVTFFWTVWKGTRAWTQWTLDKASEKILNIDSDEDVDEAKKDQ